MRFNVELLLENEKIPKDKNRLILSFLKNIFESYNKDYYKFLYEDKLNRSKDFTFALFMPNCQFTREEIIIAEKKIYLNFSTSNTEEGIFFYNAILANIGKKYSIKGNVFTPKNINMQKEKIITDDYAIFKTMSPIVIRSHTGDNSKTWYYSFKDEGAGEIFLENLKYQLLNKFGQERKLDIEAIDFEIDLNSFKNVLVKNYGIEVLSNICILKIQAKAYILDYIYKSGIGSKKSSGFGMLDLL